jgi:uncharacterized protein YjbJ (UPF0337 family)
MDTKETVDKAKGKMNEAVGAARAKAGDMTGNEEMEAKGRGQQLKGKAQGAAASAKSAAGKVADKARGE